MVAIDLRPGVLVRMSTFRLAPFIGLFAVTTLTLATAYGGQASREPRRFALVIGNAAYLGPLTRLPNAVNDAQGVGNVLTELGFNVSVVQNGTKAAVIGEIERLKAILSPDDSVVLYYAGHGVEIDGFNYMLPVDLRLPADLGRDTVAAIRRDGIEMRPIIRSFGEMAQVSIAILDACRDNPFLPTRSSASLVGIRRGLAKMEERGVLIAYAAGAGQTASDGLPGEANGLYTRELLRALGQTGIDAGALFLQVQRAVSNTTKGRQIPAVYDQLKARFIFREARKAASYGVAPAANPSESATTNPGVPPWLVGKYFNENWRNTSTRFKLEWELGISATGGVTLVGTATPAMRGAGNGGKQVGDCRLDLGQGAPMMICRQRRATTSRTSENVETAYLLAPAGQNLALSPVGRGSGATFYRLPSGR